MQTLNTPVEIAALLARSPTWVRKFISDNGIKKRDASGTKINSVRRYQITDILEMLAKLAANNPPAMAIVQPKGRKVDLLDPVEIATEYLVGATTVTQLVEKHNINKQAIVKVLRYGLKAHYGLDSKHIATLLRSRRYINPYRSADSLQCKHCYLLLTHHAVPAGRGGYCGYCVEELNNPSISPKWKAAVEDLTSQMNEVTID